MKELLRILNVPLSNGGCVEIKLGHPQGEVELNEMYKFRHDVYLNLGYIDPQYYKDGLDIDEYDREGKCIYFIARANSKLIATVRLIKDEYLPTEKEAFSFEEPDAMRKIARNKRMEIGRLIAIDYEGNNHLPRHLILLSFFKVIGEYCKSYGIEGGYAFIKNKLKKKLDALKVPFGVPSNFIQIYKEDVLKNYFSNKEDPVWPIYFIVDNLSDYINEFMGICIKKVKDKNEYIYKNDILTKLKLFTNIYTKKKENV